jgi:hypothetical protein
LTTVESVAGPAGRAVAPPDLIRYAVLCGTSDPSGPWAAAALRDRGLAGVRLVTVDEIVYSTRVVHRLGADGVRTEVTLTDGAVLGPDLLSVLNRVVTVPSEHLAGSARAERDYATQEMYALLTSVLASLPRVVNPGGPRGLPGPWLAEAEWRHAAGRAGLAGVGFRTGSHPSEVARPNHTVLVIGPHVLGSGSRSAAVPEAVADGCRALARELGTRVLGLDFVVAEGQWRFVHGNPTPDLRWGGDAAADALAQVLTTEDIP